MSDSDSSSDNMWEPKKHGFMHESKQQKFQSVSPKRA
jgi:hypothetical protein